MDETGSFFLRLLIRLRRGSFVFAQAANVEERESDLEDDERPCVGLPAPRDPEDVTREKPPEAVLAAGFGLGGDKPGGGDAGDHRRPLKKIEVHEQGAVSVRCCGLVSQRKVALPRRYRPTRCEKFR